MTCGFLDVGHHSAGAKLKSYSLLWTPRMQPKWSPEVGGWGAVCMCRIMLTLHDLSAPIIHLWGLKAPCYSRTRGCPRWKHWDRIMKECFSRNFFIGSSDGDFARLNPLGRSFLPVPGSVTKISIIPPGLNPPGSQWSVLCDFRRRSDINSVVSKHAEFIHVYWATIVPRVHWVEKGLAGVCSRGPINSETGLV